MAHHFTAETTALYEHGRPRYDDATLDALLEMAAISSTADILELGAGTGLFTGALLAALTRRGHTGQLYIVEPSAMRAHLDTRFGHNNRVTLLPSTATAAEMAAVRTASIGLVVAAQSFHWFCDMDSLMEIRRVLAPGAPFVACWHRRCAGPVAELLRQFRPEIPPNRPAECAAALYSHGGFTGISFQRWARSPQVFTTMDMFVDWLLSISYVPKDRGRVSAATVAVGPPPIVSPLEVEVLMCLRESTTLPSRSKFW